MFQIGGFMSRNRGTTIERTGNKPGPKPASRLEVPVQTMAEFVAASFTAAGQNDADPLNMHDARWYKTGDKSIALVLGDDQQQFVLEFNSEALCALAKRAESMSSVNIDDILDL